MCPAAISKVTNLQLDIFSGEWTSFVHLILLHFFFLLLLALDLVFQLLSLNVVLHFSREVSGHVELPSSLLIRVIKHVIIVVLWNSWLNPLSYG